MINDIIRKFNAVSAIEYKRCAELTVNKQYPIVNMVHVDTRYGKSVLVTLEDGKRRYRVYPVSYTHLDVYKRQAVPNGSRQTVNI